MNNEITEHVRAARRGDTQSFNKLVLHYQTKIYNLALNYVKQQEEAKDLTQEVFVTVFRSLPKLKDDTKFSSWLFQIAINHCRNRYKKLQKIGFFNSLSLNDPDFPVMLSGGESPEQVLERKDVITKVQNAITSMPAAEKEILILRDIQELSYEEISTILMVPLGTVKSKLNRARISLKNRLKSEL